MQRSVGQARVAPLVHVEGEHDAEVQLQPEPQVPVVGPVELPLRHELVAPHQPQPLRAPHAEHVVAVAQGSVGVVQLLLVHAQPEAHVPEVGPLAVPPRQELVAPHQPQLPRPVQPPHVVLLAHMSVVPPQVVSVTVQPELHVPLVGPLALPVRQVLEAPHQPQPLRPAQPEQVVPFAQGSVTVEQAAVLPAQPELHEPPVGPLVDPDMQVREPLHQPQPIAAAHEVQSR